MSQPRQPTPSQSPTPSKSSLRRTSGPQNPSQRSLIPPPSPHFDDQPAIPVRYSPRSPPNQTLEYESDDDDEPLIYPEPPPIDGTNDDSYFSYPEPERPFQPFFTLIEDGLTSEHHPPSVHYIFADDDAEIITEAALRSLAHDDLTSSSTAAVSREKHPDPQDTQDTILPPVSDSIREHYLILDVHPAQPQPHPSQHHQPQPSHSHSHSQSQSQIPPSPYTITRSTSLSPHWQITAATITSAPTIGDASDESLMLRIEGRGVAVLDDEKGGGGDERESLEEMIERFQNRLGEVRRLIEVEGGVDAGVGVLSGGGGGDGDGGVDTYESGLGYGLEEQD